MSTHADLKHDPENPRDEEGAMNQVDMMRTLGLRSIYEKSESSEELSTGGERSPIMDPDSLNSPKTTPVRLRLLGKRSHSETDSN